MPSNNYTTTLVSQFFFKRQSPFCNAFCPSGIYIFLTWTELNTIFDFAKSSSAFNFEVWHLHTSAALMKQNEHQGLHFPCGRKLSSQETHMAFSPYLPSPKGKLSNPSGTHLSVKLITSCTKLRHCSLLHSVTAETVTCDRLLTELYTTQVSLGCPGGDMCQGSLSKIHQFIVIWTLQKYFSSHTKDFTGMWYHSV